MHREPGLWSGRLSSLLIFAILLELIAPVAWALPSWDAKPNYPQARRRRHHHSDPLVRKALSKTVPGVGEAPPGTPDGLTPQSEVSDETEALKFPVLILRQLPFPPRTKFTNMANSRTLNTAPPAPNWPFCW